MSDEWLLKLSTEEMNIKEQLEKELLGYAIGTWIRMLETGMCLDVGFVKVRILRYLDMDIKCLIFRHEHLDTTIKYIYIYIEFLFV